MTYETSRNLREDELYAGDRVKGAFHLAGYWGTIREVDGWYALVEWDNGEDGNASWHPYGDLKRI